MSVQFKNISDYDYCDEREVNEEKTIRILEDHWFSGKTCYLFRKNRIFMEPELPCGYRVYTLYQKNPFVWYEYNSDVFDLMVESGWEDGIWEYAEDDELVSLIREWRLQWLSKEISGN